MGVVLTIFSLILLVVLYFIKKFYERCNEILADRFIDWLFRKPKDTKDKNDDDDFIDIEFI